MPVDTLVHAAWILPIEPPDQMSVDHVIDLQRYCCTPVYDVRSTLAYTASGGAVIHAWVEGKLLLEDSVPRTLDPEALIDAAHAWRARIRPDLRRSPISR